MSTSYQTEGTEQPVQWCEICNSVILWNMEHKCPPLFEMDDEYGYECLDKLRTFAHEAGELPADADSVLIISEMRGHYGTVIDRVFTALLSDEARPLLLEVLGATGWEEDPGFKDGL